MDDRMIVNGKALLRSAVAALLVASAVFAGTEVSSISGTPSNGFIPIGTGTGFTPAAITAGAGISVTNGSGSITVATTGANPIVANARQDTQTAADTSITTYTVGGSDTTFEVEVNVNVRTSTTYSFTATCAYTDEQSVGRTLTLAFTSSNGTHLDALTNTNGIGVDAYAGVPKCIRAKATTSITLATTGTFTTVTYNVEGVIRQVSGTGGIPAATQTTNRQTLSGTLTLTNTSASYQVLDPNGTNRVVNLPSSPTTGIWFSLANAPTSTEAYSVLIVRNSAAVLQFVVGPSEKVDTVWDGTAWRGIPVVVQPLVWFDAASTYVYTDTGLTTNVVNDGDTVKGWKDRSRNVLNVTQSATGLTWKTNVVNSLPVVRFDNAHNLVSAAISTIPVTFQGSISYAGVFARAWSTSAAARGIFGSSTAGAAAGSGPELQVLTTASQDWAANSVLATCSGSNTGLAPRAGAQYTGRSWTDNSFHMISAALGTQAGLWFDAAWVSQGTNSLQVGGGQGQTSLASTVKIGSNGGASTFWDKDIAEFLIFTAALGSSERNYWEQYLADKYGLTVTLAGPYSRGS